MFPHPVAPATPRPAPTTYRPAPTSPQRRGLYSAWLISALLFLVGGAFLLDATLDDSSKALTVKDGMADSILTYSEWPLRFATLEDCHDSPGLGRPGIMQLDCDGEDIRMIGMSHVDVKSEEAVKRAMNRGLRALIFQDGLELDSTDVKNDLSEEDKSRLGKAKVDQLRVSQSYRRGDERFVSVAFVQDKAAAMVVMQIPVKSASFERQLEEINELVRGVSLDSKYKERAGEANV